RGHHAALPFADLPEFMAKLRHVTGPSARALEFTILTAARTSETILASVGELDLAGKIWTVPADRMKSKREHQVPLTLAAIAAIGENLEDPKALIFARKLPATPLSNMAMTMLLRRLGYQSVTVHGFRSTFRDWCGDATNFPKDLAEAALAHTIENKVEAAY